MSPTASNLSVVMTVSNEVMEDFEGMKAHLDRWMHGPPYPWWVDEWEAVLARRVHDSQPHRRFARWLRAAYAERRRRLAMAVYPDIHEHCE